MSYLPFKSVLMDVSAKEEPIRDIEIPIVSGSRPLFLAKKLAIGKAGVRLVHNSQVYDFGGYSVAKSNREACRIASAEVTERVLAHPALHVDRRDPFRLWSVCGDRFVSEAQGSDVLFQGKHGVSDPPPVRLANELRYPRTNGLANHIDLRSAVQHAALEVLERHLACTAWYGEKSGLFILGNRIAFPNGYFLERFTLAMRELLPFSISVIRHEEKSIFACGSALRNSMKDAIVKSDWEALSTLDTLVSKSGGIVPNPVTLERLSRLRGEKVLELERHWNSRLGGDVDLSDIENIFSPTRTLCESIGEGLQPLVYTVLWRTSSSWTVRVLGPGLLEKRKLRLMSSDLGIPSDPFV